MPEITNGIRYNKFTDTITMLRTNPNTVCIVTDEDHRNRYPKDVRNRVFVKQIPENWNSNQKSAEANPK